MIGRGARDAHTKGKLYPTGIRRSISRSQLRSHCTGRPAQPGTPELGKRGSVERGASGTRLLGTRTQLLVARVADLDQRESLRGHDLELAPAHPLLQDLADPGRREGPAP